MHVCFHRKLLRPCWEHAFEDDSLDGALWSGFTPHLLYYGTIRFSPHCIFVLQVAGSRLTLAIDGEGKVSARVLQYMSALTLQLIDQGIILLRYCLGAGMPEALWDMGTGIYVQ